MIKYLVTYEDTHVFGQVYDNVEIPAYIENGILKIGHHGESEKYLRYVKYPDNFDVEKLEHWSDKFYVYDKKEVWQLTNIIKLGRRNNTVLCSFFRKASWDTYLCECRDCGGRYGLDVHEASWFLGRDLKLPTRCKDCRKRKRDTIR